MVVCPACGIKLDGKKRQCPHCGWTFERTGKFDCPFCGELIPVKSQKCPLCGFVLAGLPAKARSQSVDKIRKVLMADLHEIESLEVAWKAEKRFSCPKCAVPLNGEEPRCPKCGQTLLGKSGLKCPICAAPVGKRRKTCPDCGSTLGDIAKEALPIVPRVPEPVREPTAKLEELRRPRPCPTCGAIVPEEMLRCPVCDLDFTGEAPKPGVETAPKAPEIVVEETFPQPLPEVKPPAQAGPKSRKLKSEKVTTIDYGAKPGVGGLSNGLGRINGRGRVNGTGAVNGRSFVNGTGISNGLGPRERESSAERVRFKTRWQILAVFLVIIVIMSAFVVLLYSSEKEEFSIDGDFAEWEGATIYGTRIPSASPSSNITEWAVATQSSDLFLYFQTQARMMSSSVAESYYLFVDSDGSDTTGYIMESIGADYVLQITGWDNTVNSTSLLQYSSPSDQFDWNGWASSGSLSYSTDGVRMEVRASMPAALESSARFMLMSKDSMERGSVGYIAPLKGAILVVEQVPSDAIALDGIVSKSNSVGVLKIRFTSEGGSGRVDQVNPHIVGASTVTQVPSFSLDKHGTREVTITVDTSVAVDGQLISAEVLASSIVSSYPSVEIIGSGASAYVASPPATIAIDGAFADWTGRISVDADSIPVTSPSVDIKEVGNLSNSDNSFFYVSVEGEMCSGTYVPAMVVRPSGAGGGGGGVVIPTRKSAEDVLRIYVDSDRSDLTGEKVTLDSKQIGADQLIEVKGLFGRITSMTEFDYSPSGDWAETTDEVKAAKDAKRIEISVTAASLGGSADVDFIVETTSWKGRSDLATFYPSSMKASIMTWVVDPTVTSRYATSMSYQRKLFYDGANFWSFFFDGRNTVCKYSIDDGKTWTYAGRVFKTPGVNETSIWYDSTTSMVYAVGDTSLPSRNISIQMGIVDAGAHGILWADEDTNLTASLNPIAGKNTYISKDSNGYLWILTTNYTQAKNPIWHDLSAFRSTAVNSTSSWVDTGKILPYGNYEDNAKGSIVPAGSGSDMWAIYTYAGYVSAKKYQNGAWPEDYNEVVLFKPKSTDSSRNTDNSPPSVVVDDRGVVHVVYGTGRADKDKRSIPQILYSHNDTDSLTFTLGLNLDLSNDSLGIANYYPTISLDSSTNNLYVFWLQCDSLFNSKTLMGRKCVSGSWTSMVMEPQTSFTKQFLTSVYSVYGEDNICWQWTQNITAPIEVIFDKIPEFTNLTLPIIGFIVIFALYRQRSRSKNETS